MASLIPLATLGVLVACMGCGSDADIVATGSLGATGDGGAGGAMFTDAPIERLCEEGAYDGSFRGYIGSGTNRVDIDGVIHFTLEATLEREFFILKDSVLDGHTSTGVSVTADVVSDSNHGCREGAFTSVLTNGLFAGAYQFEGNVTGDYDATRRVFVGEWTTHVPGSEDIIGSGTWGALYTE